MPLPLLRIPDVALRYIANHMSKVELVKISLCSRKADRALKRCGQQELSYFSINRLSLNNLEHLELSLLEAGRAEGGVCNTVRLGLTVDFHDSVRIRVTYKNLIYNYTFFVECFNKMDQFAGIQRILMMKDTCIPVILTENGKMYTLWNNIADGLVFLLKCLNEKFSDVTFELRVHKEAIPHYIGSLRRLVHYTSSPEVSLVYFYISSNVQISIKDYRYILENVRFRDYLVTKCVLTSRFEAKESFEFHGTIPCSHLFLCSGQWITLQYLLKCRHKEMTVQGSKFTNEEVKAYINQWVAGTISDVKEVLVDMSEPFKLEFVLSGFQRCRPSKSLQIGNYFDSRLFIKGANNKVAMIMKYNKNVFAMHVNTDPDAVNVENDAEQSGESEKIEDGKEKDEEDEDEEEESSGDEYMDEDEEETDDEDEEEEDGVENDSD